MSDLVGNPEDRFSHDDAHLNSCSQQEKLGINIGDSELAVDVLLCT